MLGFPTLPHFAASNRLGHRRTANGLYRKAPLSSLPDDAPLFRVDWGSTCWTAGLCCRGIPCPSIGQSNSIP